MTTDTDTLKLPELPEKAAHPDIARVLSTSTRHITLKDNNLLELAEINHSFPYPSQDEYGFWIWAGWGGRGSKKDELEYYRQAKEKGYSDELFNLLRLAHLHGCDYVRIDRDIASYPELPTFDW